MRQTTLSGIVKRYFIHSTQRQPVEAVVAAIGLTPADLCRVIAGQDIASLPLFTYYQLARWLRMPLSNVIALAGARPKLEDLIRLGMEVRGYRPNSTQDQIRAAAETGISVAVFRRALHGYADFTPSIYTCDRLAAWLSWSGFEPDDIAAASGMVILYRPDGRRVALTQNLSQEIKPYPCACGRAGCMVPAHIPTGPRRKWRSDACRMWAKRRAAKSPAKLPQHDPIVRFIMINERSVPVRF